MLCLYFPRLSTARRIIQIAARNQHSISLSSTHFNFILLTICPLKKSLECLSAVSFTFDCDCSSPQRNLASLKRWITGSREGPVTCYIHPCTMSMPLASESSRPPTLDWLFFWETNLLACNVTINMKVQLGIWTGQQYHHWRHATSYGYNQSWKLTSVTTGFQ